MSDDAPTSPASDPASSDDHRPRGSWPDRFYLPQLDGLRFLAFLLVFLHHAPTTMALFGRGTLAWRVGRFLSLFGWCGVDLFLVLSAYLITTLLLMEQALRGRISVRGFYVRRALRIWPLYYWIVFVGFLVTPAMAFAAPPLGSEAYAGLLRNHLLAYLTLFANYSVAVHGYPPVLTLSHLWTIALEEQFYLVWPALLVLLLRARRGALWATLVALLGLTLTVRFHLIGASRHPAIWTNTLSRLDPLVLGAGLAAWRREHPAGAHWVSSLLQVLLGVGLVWSIGYYPPIRTQSPAVLWQYLATAAGFTLILDAALAGPPNPWAWILSRGPFVWLGRVSYGLYVYHILGLEVGLPLGQDLQRRLGVYSPVGEVALRTGCSLVLTVVVAALSYYFFESHFLRMKGRFSHILSGSAPAERPHSG